MFRLNIFYFTCMQKDWLYVVCLIVFLAEHILFLQTMQLESLIIQPAFIIYPIYLYYFYKFNESKINHFLLLLLKVNSWVEDEVVLLKCVNLDFILTTLLFLVD